MRKNVHAVVNSKTSLYISPPQITQLIQGKFI